MHRDVLDANPEDEVGKDRLTEELKSRAKGAMKDKNFPVADALYGKAIEVKPDATLHSNRSMARFGLGRFDDALSDALSASELDPSFAKAFYRKGQALSKLKRHAEAVTAYETGLALEPDSKVFKKLIGEAQIAAEEAENEPPPLEPQQETEAEFLARVTDKNKVPATSSSSSASSTSKPSSSSTSSSTASTRNTSAAADDDDDVSDGSKLRGYKLTSDGRKTSYFNNEMDAKTKELIGDIRPQKLETVPAAAATAPTGGTTSAWNTAGTWESRNMTSWATGHLEGLLKAATFVLPNNMGTVVVHEVKNMTGDAEIISRRGKIKFPFDFSFEVHWRVDLAGSGPCKGVLKFPDVTPDCDGEFEATFEVDRSTPPAARGVLDAFVRSPSEGLRPAIASAIETFMTDFQAQAN